MYIYARSKDKGADILNDQFSYHNQRGISRFRGALKDTHQTVPAIDTNRVSLQCYALIGMHLPAQGSMKVDYPNQHVKPHLRTSGKGCSSVVFPSTASVLSSVTPVVFSLTLSEGGDFYIKRTLKNVKVKFITSTEV